MPDDETTHALLLGRMTGAGEAELARLALARGALALGEERLWLAQPQLLGGPSVASVPLQDVGDVTVTPRRGLLGPRVDVEVVIAGRPVRFRAGGGADAAARAGAFAAAVAAELRRRA